MPADDLRARLIARLESEPLFGAAETADAVLTALVEDPGDLPKRMAEAMGAHCMLTGGALPEGHGTCTCGHWVGRDRDWVTHLAAAAMSVRWEHAAHLAAENGRLREENAYLHPAMNGAENRRQIWRERAEQAAAENDRLRRAVADVEEQRDELSEKKCAALNRAVAAERERDDLRQHILDIDAHATPYGDLPDDPGYVGLYLLTSGALHRALGKVGHAAVPCQDAVKVTELQEKLERAERELAEAKRMIDDTLWRMRQLRSWAYRDTSGDVQHFVLSVITNVWDCLDPDRTRTPSLWCEGVPPDDLAQATTESTEETNDG